MKTFFSSRLVATAFACAMALNSFAQSDTITVVYGQEEESLRDLTFETLPEFPGGTQALLLYLRENLQFPEEAKRRHIAGRVVVECMVEKDGSVDRIKVVSTPKPSLDREAVRLVRSMPKWKPGTQRGEPIAMNYVIPVFFKWEYSGEEDGDEEQIINCFEDPAMFPGGVDALINYLHENLQYPEEAKEKGIEGRVVVQFWVEKDGTIDYIEVINKERDSALGKEAIRLVNSMPKWEPATQRGEPVAMKFTLPVDFKLNSLDSQPHRKWWQRKKK